MKILDRLPVLDEHEQLDVHGEALKIRPFQIIVRVSLSGVWKWDAGAPIIPAVLDTGNNHNFSIQERQLIRWAGVHSQSLPFLGAMHEGGRAPSLRFANVWIHGQKTIPVPFCPPIPDNGAWLRLPKELPLFAFFGELILTE